MTDYNKIALMVLSVVIIEVAALGIYAYEGVVYYGGSSFLQYPTTGHAATSTSLMQCSFIYTLYKNGNVTCSTPSGTVAIVQLVNVSSASQALVNIYNGAGTPLKASPPVYITEYGSFTYYPISYNGSTNHELFVHVNATHYSANASQSWAQIQLFYK